MVDKTLHMSTPLKVSNVVDRPLLVLVIPVRNEAANVAELLRMSATVLSTIIFVDHASSDNTGALLSAGGAEVIYCQEGGGFGRAVQTGLAAALPRATGGYVGWLPGNLKSDPMDAARLTASMHNSYVYGSVYVKARRSGRPLREHIPSALAGFVLSVWGLGPYWEVGGTPTIVPALRAEVLLKGPEGLEFETFTVTAMRREKIRMLRLKAPFGRRMHGSSHWNRGLRTQMRLLLCLMREISRTRRNYR